MAKQPNSQTRRIAITLPVDVAATLSYVALRLGATKSDLLAGLIGEPLEQMRAALFRVPEPLDTLTPDQKEVLWSGYADMLERAMRDAETASAALQGDRGSNHA